METPISDLHWAFDGLEWVMGIDGDRYLLDMILAGAQVFSEKRSVGWLLQM